MPKANQVVTSHHGLTEPEVALHPGESGYGGITPRRRASRHPGLDNMVRLGILVGWLLLDAVVASLPLPLAVFCGLVIGWLGWAVWRLYVNQTRPTDDKPAMALAYRPPVPLLVRLCLLPGMAAIVGAGTVHKARSLSRLRADQRRHPEMYLKVRRELERSWSYELPTPEAAKDRIEAMPPVTPDPDTERERYQQELWAVKRELMRLREREREARQAAERASYGNSGVAQPRPGPAGTRCEQGHLWGPRRVWCFCGERDRPEDTAAYHDPNQPKRGPLAEDKLADQQAQHDARVRQLAQAIAGPERLSWSCERNGHLVRFQDARCLVCGELVS